MIFFGSTTVPASRAESQNRTTLFQRRRVRYAAALALSGSVLTGYAQGRASESAIEAAYLFNFGKFVRFPSSQSVEARQTFDICILGEDRLGTALDELSANERLDNKPVRTLRVKSADDARGCAIVYISAAERDRIATDIDVLRGQEVLTVSDAPDFLRRGGMIQFVVSQDHLRFAVNLDAVRRGQISLSSELLKVAMSVTGDPSVGVQP